MQASGLLQMIDLAIERQRISIFLYGNIGEQAGAGDAFFNGLFGFAGGDGVLLTTRATVF